MEPESPSPYSQVLATCPYPVANSIQSPRTPPTSWRSILILSSHLCLVFPMTPIPSTSLKGYELKTGTQQVLKKLVLSKLYQVLGKICSNAC
jgi:hypothetical protein